MQSQQTTAPFQASQPLVSFVITYHEQPAVMLKKCVESITRLSLRPAEREIIVIDDGSAVSPLVDLSPCADDIVYIRTANGGVSTARNIGVRMASGTFVQFVDADDMLISNVYEHCLDIARYGKVDMVMFGFSHASEASTEYTDGDILSGSDLMRTQNIHGAAWSYLFRRSIVGDLRFTPGVCYGEDEEFTPQLLLRAASVVCTTARAYFYRQHEASAIGATTHAGSGAVTAIEHRLNDNRQVIFRLNRRLDTLPPSERIALQRRVAQLSMDYLYNTIMLTRDRSQLEQRIEELRLEGLFPLPDRNYTTKYTWFRRLANSATGRTALMLTLPLMKREA